MNKIFLSLILTYASLLVGEGFAPGTLVKTVDGYVPIEEIKVDQLVESFDAVNNKIIHNKVIATRQHDSQSVINIKFDDEEIACSPDQKIYVPLINRWFEARELLINKKIRNLFYTQFDVLSITEVSDPTKLYSLTVKSQHNFFVTKRDILSHNFTFTVIWVVGEGIAFEEMAAVLASGLAGWGLGKLFYRSDNNGSSNNLPNNLPPNSPRAPHDEEDEIKIFEKNAEHMFRKDEGHLEDTLANRKLLLDLVNNKENFAGTCSRGLDWYGKKLPNGEQIWAVVKDKHIRNGGKNLIPHKFDSRTGFSRNPFARKP